MRRAIRREEVFNFIAHRAECRMLRLGRPSLPSTTFKVQYTVGPASSWYPAYNSSLLGKEMVGKIPIRCFPLFDATLAATSTIQIGQISGRGNSRIGGWTVQLCPGATVETTSQGGNLVS